MARANCTACSGAIVDGQEKLHAAFGITGAEVVYLRPDGYIGLRSGSLDAQSLSEYLRLIYASHLA